MIRKILIFTLIGVGAFFFYKKFLADTFDPFFGKHANNVDLYQLNYKDPDVKD